jgi:thermostable 8-oxoguanine DNA glycosylase
MYVLNDESLKESALNLIHKNTLEIRIFQGTINKKLVMAYLEFCLSAALYTKETSFKMVSVKGFKAYVRRNRKKFKSLNNSNLLYGKVKPSYGWKKTSATAA